MGWDRSGLRFVVPVFLAPVVVLLGWVSMQIAGGLVAGLGLGLRPTLIASEAGLALPGLIALAALGPPALSGLFRGPVEGRAAALSLAAGGAFWVTSLGLFELQYAVWQPPIEYLEMFQRLHEALRPAGPMDAVLSLAAIAFAPALFEEVLFRGIVLPGLAARWNAAPAIVGSALLFGLIHLDLQTPGAAFYRVPFAFLVGVGLGFLRVATRSLLPPLVAHATLNTITFLAVPLTGNSSAGLPDFEPLTGVGLLAVGLAASAFILRYLDGSRWRAK